MRVHLSVRSAFILYTFFCNSLYLSAYFFVSGRVREVYLLRTNMIECLLANCQVVVAINSWKTATATADKQSMKFENLMMFMIIL